MAYRSGMFNSVNGDRKYQALHFAEYFATFIGNGVFPNPSNGLQVYAKENMTVTIKPGKAWINGYYFVNDSDCDLILASADGVLKRKDRIVLRFDTATRLITPQVRKGVFSASPAVPTLQRDGDAYELALATVSIDKGTVALTQANVTDERLDTTVCGIVHGVVDQVDTATLFNQYQSWIEQQKAVYTQELELWTAEQRQSFEQWMATQHSDFANWRVLEEQEFADWMLLQQTTFNNWMLQEQQDFNEWFQTLQNLLDENTAATLMIKVVELEQKVDATNQNLSNLTQDVTDNHRIITEHLNEIVTEAEPNKILKLDNDAKLPTSITGDAATVGGKNIEDLEKITGMHYKNTAEITVHSGKTYKANQTINVFDISGKGFVISGNVIGSALPYTVGDSYLLIDGVRFDLTVSWATLVNSTRSQLIVIPPVKFNNSAKLVLKSSSAASNNSTELAWQVYTKVVI